MHVSTKNRTLKKRKVKSLARNSDTFIYIQVYSANTYCWESYIGYDPKCVYRWEAYLTLKADFMRLSYAQPKFKNGIIVYPRSDRIPSIKSLK
jgi:hypothetical protein